MLARMFVLLLRHMPTPVRGMDGGTERHVPLAFHDHAFFLHHEIRNSDNSIVNFSIIPSPSSPSPLLTLRIEQRQPLPLGINVNYVNSRGTMFDLFNVLTHRVF